MAEHEITTDFAARVQSLMDEAYSVWQKDENKNKGKWDVIGDMLEAHQIAVVFGNFNYQVENGGISQWIYNGYFHDDAEKIIGYLEIGAAFDERCKAILDRVYQLDQRAQDTNCDRDGYYQDINDEDGESSFIGDIINCDAFDTWYYANCGKDDWWETVCGIIDKAEGRDFAPMNQNEHNERFYPISVLLATEKMAKTYIVRFPTTTEDLQSALMKIGMVNGVVSAAMYYTGDNNKLDEHLPQTLTAGNFDELNYLAARLEEMSESERATFDAVIEADWHCGSLKDIINIDQNLERFDIQPAFNSEQYGEFHRDMARDEYADIVNRLLNSKDVKDRDFASYIEDVEENLNLSFYGRLQAEREGGVFTEHGYLTENGQFEEIYHGADDIPAEYRVFAYPSAPEAEKGYIIAITDESDSYIANALHVERSDDVMLYESDLEAAKAAEKDSVALIYGMKGVEDGIYIDTPENRNIISEAISEHSEPVISAVYSYAGANNERLSETVDFPASEERIAELLQNAGIDGTTECVFYVETYNSSIDGLPEFLDDIEGGVHPSELNALAKNIAGLDEQGRSRFTTDIDFAGDIESLIDLSARPTSEKETPTADDRRIIEGYEVKQSIRLSGIEMIFAENSAEAQPYMVCDCTRNNPLAIEEYSNGIVDSDYLSAMREFTRRINVRLDSLDLDRVYRGTPLTDYALTADDCAKGGMDADLEGKIVVVKAESLAPEYRSQSHQLMLATGGFGCAPNARGQAVFCTELYSGEQSRWNRSDILGVASPDAVPAWAREKLAAIQSKPPEKESVLAKIREALSKPEQPHKSKARDKSGPEL